MRTFEQLSNQEREDALSNTTAGIIYDVITGVLEIEFADPRNQREYKKIMKDAGEMDSVRAAQYGMFKHDGIRKEVEKIALIVCTESCYDKDGLVIMDESPKEKLS
jgi:hypothetical protein